jgi:hypothetical protein
VGETRVDLQHLLEDLRDAYTGALEETILTEVLANALDSGATRVGLTIDPVGATLTIVDDGRGMQRRELARYHDVAASTKSRGEGIGFAGVGIKLGLLVSREVVTETRRGASHVATRWHLASRHRAPWKWIQPPGLTEGRGTAVQLGLSSHLSPLLDAGYVEETIRRHFEPLLDPMFEQLLRHHNPHGVAFEVDGRPVTRAAPSSVERVPVSIRIGRRRTPSVVGFLERRVSGARRDESSGSAAASGRPGYDLEGIAISTFGKVIKRGWDWVGLSPAARSTAGGLIEAPGLAACLTLSKNDFVRTGSRGATYLTYRKAIQEVVSRQLAQWGDGHEADARPRIVRLERDLERVLEGLADDFPLLRSLVDRRAGGQKRLPMPGRGEERVPAPLFATVPATVDGVSADHPAPTVHSAVSPGREGVPSPPPGAGSSPAEPSPPIDPEPSGVESPDRGQSRVDITSAASPDTIAGRRRPARYGLLVQFETRPDDVELARLVDSTIWINDAHPAYTRAAASRSTGYHTALAVGMALAPLAVEPRYEHAFITQFLAQWGGAQSGSRSTGRKRRRRV